MTEQMDAVSTRLGDEGERRAVASMEIRYPGLQPVAAIPNLLELDVDVLAQAPQSSG